MFFSQDFSCLDYPNLLSSFLGNLKCIKPPWRNWLARSAVNRKVGGSSPPGGVPFSYNIFIIRMRIIKTLEQVR